MSQRLTTKTEFEESAPRLAVLIDADNAQAAVIGPLLDEIASYGDVIVRRIYGTSLTQLAPHGRKYCRSMQSSQFSSLHTRLERTQRILL